MIDFETTFVLLFAIILTINNDSFELLWVKEKEVGDSKVFRILKEFRKNIYIRQKLK